MYSPEQLKSYDLMYQDYLQTEQLRELNERELIKKKTKMNVSLLLLSKILKLCLIILITQSFERMQN